jgi:tRNA threonylcarbamoyladenosine biosynthesis protein TsaE
MKIAFSLDEIQEVAQKIMAFQPHKVLLFEGDMGMGKTTLINTLCKKMGVEGATSSPTFSIVNEYQTYDNQTIYHFDFYRLKQETEALDFGVEDYLYSGNWCFIEWAEKISSLIPIEHSIVKFSLLPDGRRELEILQ